MSQSEFAISALLPVKNGQIYLEEFLPNILAMLMDRDQLIVINDGSTDQSQIIIEKYRLQDPRIVLMNTSGIGLVSALNLGIELVNNNWVARFDVDDQYLDIRLQEQRKYLSEDVAVVFSDYQFISEAGSGLGCVYSAVLPIPTALSLVSSQRTAHPSSLINRSVLVKAGGYQTNDFPAEDLALWLRMSKFGKIISVPLPLLRYTLSSNSISGQNREIQQNKKRELIKGYGSWLSLQDRSIEDFAQTLANYREISHTPERILLHVRDLFLVSGLTGKKVPILRLALKIGSPLLLRMFNAAFKLFLVVVYRRLFRFFYQ
jgi:glycosyltransferase involved in cell wall biosynthesis